MPAAQIPDFDWKHLNYWQSSDWRKVQDKFDRLDKLRIGILPYRNIMYLKSFIMVPFSSVKVVIMGQDPYPNWKYATGAAFNIPAHFEPKDFPGTLNNIFHEYHKDLGYDKPTCGSLQPWMDQGVFLWNAIPTCQAGLSLSNDWDEYHELTREIVRRLGKKSVCFAFLGAVARRFVPYVDQEVSSCIVTSHPSPRASAMSGNPFFGSRLFSTINIKLVDMGHSMIDWRLS